MTKSPLRGTGQRCVSAFTRRRGFDWPHRPPGVAAVRGGDYVSIDLTARRVDLELTPVVRNNSITRT